MLEVVVFEELVGDAEWKKFRGQNQLWEVEIGSEVSAVVRAL